MTSTLSIPNNRKMTLFLLVISVLLAVVAFIVGIDDNLPGILLALLAATAFVLAFVHPWRTTKKFIFLFLASILGFVLFVILNIIFDSISRDPPTSGVFQGLIQTPAFDALNLIIAMLLPVAFIVGVVGSIAMFIRGRRQTK